MDGYLMQMQDLSVNDGEGIRTIVFLAGCPLCCQWCANPEGQNINNAYVRRASADEILDHIHQQDLFYQFSGGGITFSGGEATGQTEFLDYLSETLYDEGYSLALETCGQFDYEKTEPILKRMDLIFMDIKHADGRQHRKFTGAGNERILENIRRTYEMRMEEAEKKETGNKGKTDQRMDRDPDRKPNQKTDRQPDPGMVIRIPVIVGVNGNDEDLRKIFEFIIRNTPQVCLELLPYHRYGEDKYRKLKRELPSASFEIPKKADMERWRKMAEEMGIETVSFR